ncbi:type II secretion system F family protein [Nocardia beijingensis]|uniref:type II secretion system F family protein n=1 Tax=Nocardia beijingensis TaxID=95162 RepID=UPI001893D71A|nr:type II secretion system F family protein [Nocardia beijingensis]MBF6468101.1 type II secretion system F family protein [Nocardia beijingensis]
MSGAVLCLALAMVVVPAPRSRRRFGQLFIARAEYRMPEPELLFGLGAGIGMVFALVVFGPGPFLAACMIAGTVGLRARRVARERRRNLEQGRLLDALEAVIAELRVGAHPSAAAESAAREAQGASAQAFAVGAARSRLGGSAAAGLRWPDSPISAELARVAGAWQVAEQHGLALAELLSAVRTDLAGRLRFHGRTTAALAGARATAAVLACLPFLGIALGQMMGAAPLHVLFVSSAGTVLLPLGAGLACAGLLWTDVITRKVLL